MHPVMCQIFANAVQLNCNPELTGYHIMIDVFFTASNSSSISYSPLLYSMLVMTPMVMMMMTKICIKASGVWERWAILGSGESSAAYSNGHEHLGCHLHHQSDHCHLTIIVIVITITTLININIIIAIFGIFIISSQQSSMSTLLIMSWAVIKISEHRGTIKVRDFNRGGE